MREDGMALGCGRAAIAGLSIHDLRRAATSSLQESGVPLAYVSEFLGHPQMTTTSRYIQASRQEMQECPPRRKELHHNARALSSVG